jgi:hypothetical protein
MWQKIQRSMLARMRKSPTQVVVPSPTWVAPDGYITVLKHRVNFPESPGGQRIMSIVQENSAIYSRHLENTRRLQPWLETIPFQAKDDKTPFWNNEFIPAFDAVSLALMLLETKAEVVLEIGSGNSTKFLRSAIDFFKMNTTIVSIDPYPRAEVEELCDRTIRKSLENATEEVLELFRKRPLVFFDGSHRVLPNSDVMVFFLELLPALPCGCIYGLHDINLPYDYFDAMARRMYTEQYMLAAYLLGGGNGDEVELPTCYLTTTGEFNRALPTNINFPTRNGESFWLRRGTRQRAGVEEGSLG